jgi:histidinol phosphatase-like PHP family hydrolase
MIKTKRDFHMHATAYREGNSKPDHTVRALIDACVSLGLDVIGVGEHLNRSAKHPLHCYQWLAEEYRTLTPPIKCFLGAEIDILDRDGNVTCSPETKKELGIDYLLGSVHVGTADFSDIGQYIKEELARHLGMMKNCPHVSVVAHPWIQGIRWERAGLVPRWSFELIPADFQDSLIDTAKKHGKAIEVNFGKNETVDDDCYTGFIRKIVAAGVLLSIGSDAHEMGGLSRSLYITEFLNGLGIEDRHLWRPDE